MAKSKSLKQIQKELTYESRKYDLEVAARKFNGNFSIMAKDTGISVQQIQSFYRTHPDFKEIVDVAREALYHTALAKLAELIEEGNVAALNLFFNRSPWAKQNGWSEKVETDSTVKLSDTEKAQKAKEILGI
jgi:hypothetical protein